MKALLTAFCFALSQVIHSQVNYLTNPNINWSNENCLNQANGSPIKIDDSLLTNNTDYKIAYISYSDQFVNVQRKSQDDKYFFTYDKAVNNYVVLQKLNVNYTYFFKEVNYHCPSEHIILRQTGNCEVQIIHQRTVSPSDNDPTMKFLYISYLVGSDGSKETQLIPPLVKSATYNLDFSTILTANTSYYLYQGSQTIPPCEENAYWLIAKVPIKASSFQINDLKNWISLVYNKDTGNRREEQALNNRPVYSIDYPTSTLSLMTNLAVTFILALILI